MVRIEPRLGPARVGVEKGCLQEPIALDRWEAGEHRDRDGLLDRADVTEAHHMDWADLQLRDDLGRSVLLADHRKANREWRDIVVLGSHRPAVGTAVEVQSRRVGEARSDGEARPDDEHHGGSRAGDANSGGDTHERECTTARSACD